MRDKIIKLPIYNIEIELSLRSVAVGARIAYHGGIINTKLDPNPIDGSLFTIATALLERTILAAACSGIDVTTPAFLEIIETVVDYIANEFGDD